MATKKETRTQRLANQVRDDLLRALSKVGEVESDWRHFRSRDIPSLKVEPWQAQAMDLICRRAETNCLHIIGQIIIGLAALDRGDVASADHAADTCWRLIRFDMAADEVIETLLAGEAEEVAHG